MVTYKEIPIRLAMDLQQKLLGQKRLKLIFKVLKDENWQPIILYPEKLSFRYEV